MSTKSRQGHFSYCTGLTNITIPNSITGIKDSTFYLCTSLTSVTIPDGINFIGSWAFAQCSSLTSLVIPSSVTNIGDYTFSQSTGLRGIYFKGNAPSIGSHGFDNDNNAIAYYLPGTTGWGSTFGGYFVFQFTPGIPAVLWNPQAQTADASFGVRTNRFGFNITGSSNLVIVVEACTNLTSPVWQPLRTNNLASGSSYFSDPQWTNYPRRFYRLRSP